MKANLLNTQLILTPSVRYLTRNQAMHSFLLRHVTPQTLAIVLFVLFAVLGAIGARESEVGSFPRRNCQPSGEPRRHAGSISQSAQNVVHALKEQLNSPALIQYAEKQGDFDSPANLSRSQSKQQALYPQASRTQPSN